MSWQACEAVRACSEARGSQRSVLYTLATYADEWGENAFPNLDNLMAGAGVARATAVKGLRQGVERGELKQTGRRRSGTYVYSLAPLLARQKEGEASSADELLPSSTSELADPERSSIENQGSSIRAGSSSIGARLSSASEHEPSVDPPVKSSNESSPSPSTVEVHVTDAESPAESGNRGQGNQEEIEEELEALRSALEECEDGTPLWSATQRRVRESEAELEELRA